MRDLNPVLFEVVCTVVMIGVNFSTFCALIKNCYDKGAVRYWKLILATSIMTTIYVLAMVELTHHRVDHGYNAYKWNQLLRNGLFGYTWPFGIISTVLYTWQYFDLVAVVAYPDMKCCAIAVWLPACVVVLSILGLTTIILSMDYYEARIIWLAEPLTPHFHIQKANQMYYNIFCPLEVALSWALICNSLISSVFLGGTIFMVRQIKESDTLKADSFNLYMVLGHITLLVV